MNAITKRVPSVLAVLLMVVAMAQAQTQRQNEAFSVQGYPGQTSVVQFQGRKFVDLEDLARITNGSLSFEASRIVLALPGIDALKPAADAAAAPMFSTPFRRAAIEAMASMREWGGMLLVTVQNGYPVGKTGVENTITVFQGRTADSIALAATAASTDSDYRGLELLRNEFSNVQNWADRFIKARNSMSAVNLTTSENLLKEDPEVDKMLRCGQFLAKMFAGGSFEDNPACH